MDLSLEAQKWIAGAIGLALMYFFMRGVKSKEEKKNKAKITVLEAKVANDENETQKSWFEFFTTQLSVNLGPITGNITKIIERLDIGDKRFDKLENITRQISIKIPQFIETNGTKALILEDDVMAADMITLALEKHKIYTVRVESSKEAIYKVNQYSDKPFDMAIADLNLKGDMADDFINYCISNNILTSNKGLKILLYSGLSDVKNNKWGLPYLEKPFDVEALYKKVEVFIP